MSWADELGPAAASTATSVHSSYRAPPPSTAAATSAAIVVIFAVATAHPHMEVRVAMIRRYVGDNVLHRDSKRQVWMEHVARQLFGVPWKVCTLIYSRRNADKESWTMKRTRIQSLSDFKMCTPHRQTRAQRTEPNQLT